MATKKPTFPDNNESVTGSASTYLNDQQEEGMKAALERVKSEQSANNGDGVTTTTTTTTTPATTTPPTHEEQMQLDLQRVKEQTPNTDTQTADTDGANGFVFTGKELGIDDYDTTTSGTGYDTDDDEDKSKYPAFQAEKPMSLDEWLAKNNTDKPLTEKEKKKKKRAAIFTALGEGISALSNLVFAAKDGVPSWYGNNKSGNVVKAAQDREDYLRKVKEELGTKRLNEYLAYLRTHQAGENTRYNAWKDNRRFDLYDRQEERREKENERKERELNIRERYNQDKDWYQRASIEARKEYNKNMDDYHKGLISVARFNAENDRIKAEGYSTETEYERDMWGNVTGKKETKESNRIKRQQQQRQQQRQGRGQQQNNRGY